MCKEVSRLSKVTCVFICYIFPRAYSFLFFKADENTDDLDHVSKSSGRGIGDRNQVSDR